MSLGTQKIIYCLPEIPSIFYFFCDLAIENVQLWLILLPFINVCTVHVFLLKCNLFLHFGCKSFNLLLCILIEKNYCHRYTCAFLMFGGLYYDENMWHWYIVYLKNPSCV